jgi:hypothetical protein
VPSFGNSRRAAGIAFAIALCASPQSAPAQLFRDQQMAFETCVWAMFLDKSGNAAAEWAFTQCQIEENALFTACASYFLIPGSVGADVATLRARAAVDRLKLAIKQLMLAPPPRPATTKR